MKKLYDVVSKLSLIVSYISFVGIVVMMCLITVDVILRKFFNTPITGSYEIVQYLLMIVVFASFAYTQVMKKHVRVTLFLAIFPWQVHTFLMGLWEILCAVAAGITGYAAIVQALYLLDKGWTSDVLRFPTCPFYFFEGIVLFLFALMVLLDAIRYFGALGNEELAKEQFKEYS